MMIVSLVRVWSLQLYEVGPPPLDDDDDDDDDYDNGLEVLPTILTVLHVSACRLCAGRDKKK